MVKRYSLKIGFISTVAGYQWAGSEELWYAAAIEGIATGHSVEISVALDIKNAPQIKKLTDLGGKVCFRNRSWHPRLAILRETAFSSFRSLCKASDVVLLSLGSLLDPIYVPCLLKELSTANVPFIILCQFNAEILKLSQGDRAIIQTLFNAAAGYVFVSEHNLLLTQRQLAMCLKKATVIYNPIRCKISEPLPWQQLETVQMGCVARFETLWKGHDVLLDILSRPQWIARQWHLNLYGSGPDEQYIQQLIRHYNLESRVTCRGYVRDIQSVWMDNHVMVLASRGEGTPLAILEAMMCGRPTITSDVGGNREVLIHGETGFIADVATPFSFGSVLEEAWENRDRWLEMGQAAHRAAKKIAKNSPGKELLNYIQTVHAA